jgi:hypothetical protein
MRTLTLTMASLALAATPPLSLCRESSRKRLSLCAVPVTMAIVRPQRRRMSCSLFLPSTTSSGAWTPSPADIATLEGALTAWQPDPSPVSLMGPSGSVRTSKL